MTHFYARKVSLIIVRT